MDLNNAYERAVLESLPIEMFPGYIAYAEPIPLHGPDYSHWTLSELLYNGLLVIEHKGTSLLDILNNHNMESNLVLVISWYKIAGKTLADYDIFPKFPFKIKIN